MNVSVLRQNPNAKCQSINLNVTKDAPVMWIDRIRNLNTLVAFAEGNTESAIVASETSLSVKFPQLLRQLLCETDGVVDEYGISVVWNLDRIRDENIHFRNDRTFADLYMPFDHLLFFAESGNGDQFAYPIQNGRIQRPDIFVWDHETDDRRWAAGSLDQYLQWSLDGTMTR